MVCEIIWSSFAIKTYIDNINYLQLEWTDREVANFIQATHRKLNLLSNFPNAGIATNKRIGLRKTIVVKRILLIYRYKPRKHTIELVQFFNTWQNPIKMKKS